MRIQASQDRSKIAKEYYQFWKSLKPVFKLNTVSETYFGDCFRGGWVGAVTVQHFKTCVQDSIKIIKIIFYESYDLSYFKTR